jgi:hypothetical protein
MPSSLLQNKGAKLLTLLLCFLLQYFEVTQFFAVILIDMIGLEKFRFISPQSIFQ